MVIDKPEHQQILLEMINQATFPGRLLETAAELKRAIESAEVGRATEPTGADGARDAADTANT
jgi:hypothetical protein